MQHANAMPMPTQIFKTVLARGVRMFHAHPMQSSTSGIAPCRDQGGDGMMSGINILLYLPFHSRNNPNSSHPTFGRGICDDSCGVCHWGFRRIPVFKHCDSDGMIPSYNAEDRRHPSMCPVGKSDSHPDFTSDPTEAK